MIDVCNLERESLDAFMKVVGKKIMDVRLQNDVLFMSFGSQGALYITDEGQSCCENRYITTDDKLEDYVGGNLLNIEVKPVPVPMLENRDPEDYSDVHDIEFVEISTTKGSFVLVTHNEHNGYYGGFSIQARYEAA